MHEFGHALGIRHSDEEGALMTPVYEGYIADFQLHSDDIEAVQALYGDFFFLLFSKHIVNFNSCIGTGDFFK